MIFDNIGDKASLGGEFMNVCKQADEDGTLKVKATADRRALGKREFRHQDCGSMRCRDGACVLQRFSAPGNQKMRGLSRV